MCARVHKCEHTLPNVPGLRGNILELVPINLGFSSVKVHVGILDRRLVIINLVEDTISSFSPRQQKIK